jgi:hypothetical protein
VLQANDGYPSSRKGIGVSANGRDRQRTLHEAKPDRKRKAAPRRGHAPAPKLKSGTDEVHGLFDRGF